MNIITGRVGRPHVTSQQQRDINSAIFGKGDYVLDIGKRLSAQQIDSNTIRIFDGQLSMQGCIASIDANEFDDIVIENGTIGMQRCDLIVAHYTKNEVEDGQYIENVNLEVIKGVESVCIETDETTVREQPYPTEPINNPIRDGSSSYYFPIYEVIIEELNIKSINPRFAIANEEDTGWIPVEYTSNFHDYYSTGQKLECRKIGKMVEISGVTQPTKTLKMSTINDEYIIATIPTECAPSKKLTLLCQGSGIAVWCLIVDTEGNLIISRYRRGADLYDLNSSMWLSAQAMYFTE